MAVIQTLNIGLTANDGTGDSIRVGGDKINQNFTAVNQELSGKENTISSGTTSQYWRGDKTWQTLSTLAVTENTNLYFTNSRAIGSTLTGYAATSGTLAATDSILQGIQKLGFDKHVAVTLATNHGLSLTGQQLAMGTPSTLTGSTTNSVSTTTHAHAITGAALTKTDDTNVTLTLGGTPSTGMLKATSLTLGWTGQLAVGRGGTGAATLTGILVGTGTGALSGITGTASQLLRRNSGNTAYEFFSPLYISANQTITLSGAVTGSGATSISTTLASSIVGYSNIATSLTSRQVISASDVDWSIGAVFTKTLSVGTTLTFSNLQLNKVITAVITGDFTLALPTYCKRIYGTYDGTVSNYIQFHCTNATTGSEEVWYTILQAIV